MHELVVILLSTVFATFVVSVLTYLVLGQRVLREMQDRFPVQWEAAGEPTFASLAIWGRPYWRPIAAGNYFFFREYQSLHDGPLRERAHRVRTWQAAAYMSTIAFVVFGCFATLVD